VSDTPSEREDPPLVSAIHTRRGHHHAWRVGLLMSAALAVLAGWGPLSLASSRASASGTVTFAEHAGLRPTYIFPLYNGAESLYANQNYLMPLMWRPLYWEGHPQSTSTTIDYAMSLADPPVWSDGGRTATITLKHYMWSDGVPLSTRDIEFWLNLLRANAVDWVGDSPVSWIHRIAAVRYETRSRFSITFNGTLNHYWLINNGLVQIFPIPQQVWDRTSSAGSVGNYDRSASGAHAVYNFLNSQSKSLTTWDTNPLWQVVDGPYHLKPGTGFDATTGFTTLVPNLRYSGSPKPRIAALEEVPFTSDTAELDALLAGRIDYGYLPYSDLTLRHRLQTSGYTIKPWTFNGFTAIELQYANPRVRQLFRQLYIRQALQHLIDQPQYVSKVLGGYGIPNYGLVPLQPSLYVTRYENHNPNRFDPAAARSLLQSHGWHVVTNGLTTCTHPGAGARECGAGIASGAPLQLTLLYSAGVLAYAEEMQAFRSTAITVGIDITLETAPGATVVGDVYACTPTARSGCRWDLTYTGSPSWTLYLDTYPSNADYFASGSAGDIATGPAAPPVLSRSLALAGASHTSPSLGGLFTAENYWVHALPTLLVPNTDYQISVISKRLHGLSAQNPLVTIEPEFWYLGR